MTGAGSHGNALQVSRSRGLQAVLQCALGFSQQKLGKEHACIKGQVVRLVTARSTHTGALS